MSMFDLNTWALKKFSKELAETPTDLKYGLRGTLRSEAIKMMEEAKFLSSWSTRIPASIHAFNASDHVIVRAGGASAPHAPAFDNRGKPGSFRHPVFGNREVWVAQRAKPFFTPAFRHREAGLSRTATKTVDGAFIRIGYV